jgi:bifunctional UDP-N-acetylglucosamine pyrophosphorylase/glucosamine-1-phosphate N-acetyltransferase
MKNPDSNPSRSRLCAVVPAAGRGTRLDAKVPKVFVPILPSLTIWDAVRNRLSPLAGRIVLVLSPEGRAFAEKNRDTFSPDNFADTVIGLQPEPRGMGDAIFGAADLWREYDDLLVVWGDQFNLSQETLAACVALHSRGKRPALTLPVVRMAKPYVEYVFDAAQRLIEVRQSREGDACAANGFSDLGTFLLSGGDALLAEWRRYRSAGTGGSRTGEINFLPFLVHLSTVAGWPVHRYEASDPAEAVGINTPEDLAFARQLLQKRNAEGGESS